MWYIVQPGDCLSRISQQFGVPIQTLVWANSISNGVLYIGQRLFIPSPSRFSLTYYVKVGDTLESIARQFNTTKHAIMQLNKLDSDFIVPGQKLQIETRFVFSGQTGSPHHSLTDETAVFPEPELQSGTPVRPAQTYKVDIGDTLDSIAKQFNTTKQAVMEMNKLASEEIKAGQTLIIPTGTPSSRQPPAPLSHHPSPPVLAPYKIEYMTFHDNGLKADIKTWKAAGKKGTAFFFVSKMSVTAAGAAKAFHRNSELAFDFLNRAGTEGYWWGLVTDSSGNPLVQGSNDPAPGYYISKTVLSDCSKPVSDPTRYLDATVIPYIALPARHMMGAKIGDLCMVMNTMNNTIGYAIVGDAGPDDSLGIGSIALAAMLGIPSSPKSGGIEDGILYIVFAQSGENICSPKTPRQIAEQAQQLFAQWGGMNQVYALFKKFPLSFKTTR
ncbi:LysM peptidoglycan-binding domain-containing protein [Paenibacillus elgii]